MVRAAMGALAWTMLLTGLAQAADDPIFSGPQVGEKLTALKVQGVLGAQAGKELDLVAEAKGGPLVLIFVHEITRPGRQAMLPLDALGEKWAKDGLTTHFIWLTADKGKTEEFLKTAQRSLSFKSPVSISLDGLEGPGNYGLNRKVTLTILVAKDNKVVANHAIVQPNETDAPKILNDIAKMLGKPEPTKEELQALGGPGRRPPVANVAEPEGAQAIKESMRAFLKETDKEKIEKTFQRMGAWAGQDRKRAAWLNGYLALLFEKQKYGTKEVQDGYAAWKKSQSR
ncbi:MAG: hypothetical protein AB7K24_28780 [Gemmataceae bacterium]